MCLRAYFANNVGPCLLASHFVSHRSYTSCEVGVKWQKPLSWSTFKAPQAHSGLISKLKRCFQTLSLLYRKHPLNFFAPQWIPLNSTNWALISARVNCTMQREGGKKTKKLKGFNRTSGLFTAENEVDAWQGGQSGLGGLRAADLGALHSHQGEGGAEEAQTHGGDHQAAAHLDVGFATRGEERTALKTPHLTKSKAVNWSGHRCKKK